MQPDTPSGTRTGNPPPTRHAPAVGVVAPRPLAQKLIAVLERDGLHVVETPLARRAQGIDVLVLAVESPTSGESEIRASRDEHPSAQLVLVVGTATPAEARQLLVDDVPGLVLEQHAESDLALAARTTLVGQISYPAELMPTQLKTALSTREKQILGMVVMGFSNAEIAAKLFVSQSTVKSHL